MVKWKKDAKEFEVSVNTLKSQNNDSKMCVIPKPIMDFLKNPDKLQFKITNKKVEVERG